MIEYEDLLGIPYVRHGSDPSRGLDCLYITAILLKRAGVEAPTGTDEELYHMLTNSNGDWVRKCDHPTRVYEEGDVVLLKGSDRDPFGVGVVVRDKPRVLVATSLVGKGTTLLNSRQLKALSLGVFSYYPKQ